MAGQFQRRRIRSGPFIGSAVMAGESTKSPTIKSSIGSKFLPNREFVDRQIGSGYTLGFHLTRDSNGVDVSRTAQPNQTETKAPNNQIQENPKINLLCARFVEAGAIVKAKSPDDGDDHQLAPPAQLQ